MKTYLTMTVVFIETPNQSSVYTTENFSITAYSDYRGRPASYQSMVGVEETEYGLKIWSVKETRVEEWSFIPWSQIKTIGYRKVIG